MVKKIKKRTKPDLPIVKDFVRLNQIMDFFPARNLKANYLTLAPGENIGAHKTDHQREVIGVLQGIGWAVVNSEVFKLTKNQMIYLPKGKLCNFYNRNKIDLKIIQIVSQLDK